MSRLVEFYRGQTTDSRGRTLADLWTLDDDRMESVHDFIQWIFPLREPSRYNPDAPLLTDDDVRSFRDDPALRQALGRSFGRFLAFLGLEYSPGGGVVEAGDFGLKKAVFLRPNHNWLRITRVLACTRTLGLVDESRGFFEYLRDRRDRGIFPIDAETFRYWEAAGGFAPGGGEAGIGRPRA